MTDETVGRNYVVERIGWMQRFWCILRSKAPSEWLADFGYDLDHEFRGSETTSTQDGQTKLKASPLDTDPTSKHGNFRVIRSSGRSKQRLNDDQ